MNRIKVLHTLCRIDSGGVEQLRLFLSKNLSAEKYEHLVICQEANGALPALFEANGWKIAEIGLASHILDFEWHNRAYCIAKQFGPQIVHGAVYEGEALASSIGLRIPEAKVILEETSDPTNRRWSGNLLMKLMCMSADRCVGVSPAATQYLTEKINIRVNKVLQINNAVERVQPPSKHCVAKLRNEFGLSEEHFVVGSVGRIEDDPKRFSDLLRAVSILKNEYSQLRLLIVGDGPDLARLKFLANELGIRERVVFAGYQGDARKFYSLMDLFVLVSQREAFGLVFVEAMFSNVPVIGSEAGGIPFVLDGGRAGVLVPAFAPDALAESIENLMNDSDLCERYAVAGLRRAEQMFSVDRYVSEIDQLYSSIIGF